VNRVDIALAVETF